MLRLGDYFGCYGLHALLVQGVPSIMLRRDRVRLPVGDRRLTAMHWLADEVSTSTVPNLCTVGEGMTAAFVRDRSARTARA